MSTLHRRIRGDLQPIVQNEAQLIFVFKMLAPFIHRLSLECPQVIAEVSRAVTMVTQTYINKVKALHIPFRLCRERTFTKCLL